MSDIHTEAHQSADVASDKSFNLREALEAEAARQAGSETAEEPQIRDDGRDEKGRFAPKEKTDDDGQRDPGADRRSDGGDQTDGGGERQADEQGRREGGAVSPPPGWSVASKAAWNDLPEAVRADIAKREQEVSDGFKQYSGMGDLKPYAEAYARNGATVKQALDSYLAVDRALATDFAGGIANICRHYGVDPRALAQHFLGGQQPDQNGQAPAGADPQLVARLAQLEQHLANQQRLTAQQEQQGAQQTIEQFAADPKHLFFENVKVTMGHLIQTGQASGLDDAYDKAIWMHPEIRPQLLKQQQAEAAIAGQATQRQAAAAQARQSAKSLTGSPTPGGSSVDRSKPRTIREIAEEAARAQGVSV